MTTKELLNLMRLLSAMESWAMSQQTRLPPYLHEAIDRNMKLIEAKILELAK